jgi:hypothetical protein
MIFAAIGVVVVMVLMYLALVRFVRAPAQISQPDTAYASQSEIFKDMQPSDQTREGAWVGFLQEDVHKGRTGPIGDFQGNDSNSGKARLYDF